MKRSIFTIGTLAVVGFTQGAYIQNKLQATTTTEDSSVALSGAGGDHGCSSEGCQGEDSHNSEDFQEVEPKDSGDYEGEEVPEYTIENGHFDHDHGENEGEGEDYTEDEGDHPSNEFPEDFEHTVEDVQIGMVDESADNEGEHPSEEFPEFPEEAP